jgi:cytoskeletal protein CcmA (bactofilin family)
MFLSIGAARDHRFGQSLPAAWPDSGGRAHTVIHADLTVLGDLLTDGHIEVLGRIDGTTNSHSIVVQESGWIDGTVLADVAEIRGTVVGAVRATTVVIGSNARVFGSIFHNSLTIEPGAQLEGRRPWRPNIDRKQEQA